MRSLFFINSPFQLLCAVEAQATFKTINNILIIFNKGFGNNYYQIQEVLKTYGQGFSKIEVLDFKLKSVSGWRDGFSSMNRLANKYPFSEYIFIGDYQNGLVRHFQNSVKYMECVLLDDGFATIRIGKALQRGDLVNYRDYVKFLISGGRYKFKPLKNVPFFSIYDGYLGGGGCSAKSIQFDSKRSRLERTELRIFVG